MYTSRSILTAVAFLVLTPLAANGQYEVSWHSIDGGGTMSATFGDYTLSGTIGQCDASELLSGGTYTLTGGFWTMDVSSSEWLPGDMNCDGFVGFADINPFVLALVDGEMSYAQQYPDCDFMNADVNGSGTVGFDDINPFVALLLG